MTTETDIGLLKEKIDSINREAWETRVNDSPRSLRRSEESLELAKSINYQKGIADGLRNIGFCNIRLARNDEAVPLLNEAFTIYEAIDDLSGQALVHEYLGIVHRNKGDFGGSLELLFKALALTENTPVDENHATHYYQLGVTYKHLGDFETALEYFYRAMTVCRAINNSLYEGYCINLIGSIYFENGDYLKALDYFLQGLPMRRAGGDKWGEAGSLDNIGITYLKLNELDKAIDFCKQSLAISQSTGDKKGEANALLHLAEIYEQAGDIKKASKFSNQSLEIRKARGDKRGEAEVLLFLADLHKKRRDIDDQQIFSWISGAVKIAEEIKAQDLLSKAYYNLYEYHGQKGNYKESLAQLEAHLQIEKELHKNTISQKVSNLEISHKAEAISQRNKELTELNEKIEKANAELKIEASLERVRAVAMGMKRPDDVLNVCEILFAELELLGFKELRNAMVNIYYDEKECFWNYDFSGSLGRSVTRFSNIDTHPVPDYIRKQIRLANSSFAEIALTGSQLESWKEYREKNGELPDPKLMDAKGLYYYFYSVGTAAIGISTLRSITKEEHEILKRFRNVFDLCYRRYIDIEKAEAQAREAQIEVALERIRARAMAMHSSDELIEVANILREQMGLLGQPELETSVVNIIDENSGIINNWNAYREPGLSSGTITTSTSSFPINSSELTREMVDHYQSGEKEFTMTATGAKLHEFFEVLMRADPQVTNYSGNNIPEKIFYHFTSFTGGTLLTVSYQPPTEDVKSLQRRAASVFDMAYRRYLDLKKAEAQAREAQIETGLERVRSKTMAMHKSEEVTDVAVSLNDELLKLGFEGGSTIMIIDKETGNTEQWTGFSADKSLKSCYVPYFKHPYHNALLDAWKNGERFLIYTVAGNDKISLDEHYFTTGYKDFPESDKRWMRQMESVTFSHAFMKYGAIHWGPGHLTEEQLRILEKFSKVFEQSYTRFRDLQKAEAQAREAQIEAALERVRSRTMGMQRSDELPEAANLLFRQIESLGIHVFSTGYNIWQEGKETVTSWMSSQGLIQRPFKLPLTEEPALIECHEAAIRGDAFFVQELSGDKLISHFSYMGTLPVVGELMGQMSQAGIPLPHRMFNHHAFFLQGYLMFITYDPVPEAHEIFKRFAKVFEQTYTRFLDLQKAEAQAREAQIEAALERVRSRSMAMHKSDELLEVVASVFQQIQLLGFNLNLCNIVLFDNKTLGADYWASGITQAVLPESYHVPYADHPLYNYQLSAWKNAEPFAVFELGGELKKSWDEILFTKTDLQRLPDSTKKMMQQLDKIILSSVATKHGLVQSIGTEELSNDDASILSRFAKVFDQTYTRFLDLQKAEAQAREAQIEAALEKVRAKVMAMKSSGDLNETSLVFGEQLRKLGIDWQFSYFWLIEEDKDDNTFWITWPDNKTSTTTYSLAEADESFRECIVAWREQSKIHATHVPAQDVQSWLDTFERITNDAGGIAKNIMTLENFKEGVYYYDAMIKFGSFGITTNGATNDEEKNIQSRFAIEFERAYTRFLDLKKAEAQAREAQIEVAVERVRAKALAMHKSEDLHSVVVTLKKELNGLKIPGVTAATIYLQQDDGFIRILDLTTAREDEEDILELNMDTVFRIEDTDPDLWVQRMWYGTENYFVVEADEDDFVRVVKFLYTIDKESAVMAENIIKEKSIKKAWLPTVKLEKGRMNVDLLEPPVPEVESIMLKMGAGFDLAYKRFLDLQKAEAQTREANIEVALERVRARALAMQQPEELKDVAQVLRNEMGALGVEELETSSIYIHGESSENVECWYALQDPKHTEKKMVSDHFLLNLNETWVGREMKRFYSSGEKQTSIVMQGANRKEWIEYCYKHSPAFSGFYGETIPDRTYHLYKFSHGYIGAAAPGDISAESWKLLGRAASVFSLAYSRFKDLTQARIDLMRLKEEKKRAEDALAELQNTQKQLIQTEKMASLGELTAGIAHEIQNPLNFVNNFSDVSNELIEEMKEELAIGNTQHAILLANDVKDNLEKILHHGKRADGIVKGMLQHSRTSSGTKEPTDINNLADEYLRLAYHGFRAKDKSFSAKFETQFDNNIEKINVVPQDIGRVILNLINNAFYTVNEKKKRVDNGYEPIVTVSTKKIKDKLEIRVKDNGNGIPQKALDKIFQPFFTTKPTGQGTGLGLSLSYDIVTKGHQGEIKVETKEGEGCEFTITLPAD